MAKMRSGYDVVIIGAGPSGLACAQVLSESSKSVLLIEKNQVIGPKVCAGGLTTKIKNIGYDLKIADMLFSEIKMNVPGKSFRVEMNDPFVATIDRKKLADEMLKNIPDKMEIVTGKAVQKISKEFIEVDGQKIGYKYLVGADGSNSVVRRWLGLKVEKAVLGLQYIVPEIYEELELFFDAKYFGNSYGWIFPHGKYTSIGCGGLVGRMDSAKIKSNFQIWLKDKNIDVGKGRLEGWLINFDYRGYDFGNVFLAGDAAGFASGMTGEGIYFAMVSGTEIANKIINPDYGCEAIKKVLTIKRRQEKYLYATRYFGRALLNTFYKLFPHFLNWDWAKKRAISLFC